MTNPVNLALHEQLLLLALHDEKGTAHTSMFSYAIAGAIIAELLDTRRLRIEQHRRHATLVVANPSSTADPLLDECVQRVASAPRPAAVSTWVSRFAAIKELKERIADRLCHRGILKRSEDRVWWVFPRVVYPTADPAPEDQIVATLHDAIADDGEIDARTAIVVALAHSAGILPHVFDRALLEARAARIETMVRMTDVSGATKDAIEGARAAVMILGATTAVTPTSG
jgi:golgi phosphoprotein 3